MEERFLETKAGRGKADAPNNVGRQLKTRPKEIEYDMKVGKNGRVTGRS